ncbi:MAG: Haloacid dehalogenase-like protein family hydrolase [Parcubacteria group bacterium GW2011_GWC1_41_7]|nr:MAG: Haloacid dehalogenase-like protein family hydrolase [Parcubacteria group bacterium GW2011_GWC1_41_7]
MSAGKTMKKISMIIYSIYFYAVLGFFLGVYYLYGLLTTPKTNLKKWRLLAHAAITRAFSLSGIHIIVSGKENLPNGTAVLCANHQSYLDGLVVSYATGIPFTAVTAPFKTFPALLRFWFARMAFIQVQRDVFEELKYTGANARDAVIQKAIHALQNDTSLLIFPEGRRELHEHLLPFHAGVAKIAIAACAPIVPITLKNIDHILPAEGVLVSPGIIEVVIHKPIMLHRHPKSLTQDAEILEEIIEESLPISYVEQKSIPHTLKGKRAAFFDLDGTLTKKDVWKMLGIAYIKKHKDKKLFWQFTKLSLIKRFLKHGYLYLSSMKLLKGVRVEEFQLIAKELLEQQWDDIFYADMLALMLQHKKDGNDVFIITEEPDALIAPIFNMLGAEGYGTIVEIQNGKMTGKVKGRIMKDAEKLQQARKIAHEHHIDLSKSYAYGNTWHDFDLVTGIEHGYVVHPSPALKKRAKREGVRVIYPRV